MIIKKSVEDVYSVRKQIKWKNGEREHQSNGILILECVKQLTNRILDGRYIDVDFLSCFR